MKLKILFVVVLILLISCTKTGQDNVSDSLFNKTVIENITLVTPVDINIEGNYSNTKPIKFDSDNKKSLNTWDVIYDGFGHVGISDNHILLYSKSDILGNETHSALVTYYRIMPREYVLDLKLVVHKQFRKSPNPWEVGWVLFNYKDANNFYYFIPKTNGIELGKVIEGRQEFLFTADNPKTNLKVPVRLKLILNNGRLDVFVNSVRAVRNYPIDYIDNSKIGLYSEDSEVEFIDVKSYKP